LNTDKKMKGRAISYLILCGFAVIMIYPFLWAISTSFKPLYEAFSPNLVPKNPTLENYRVLFSRTLFPRWIWNSLIVAVGTVASVLLFCSLVGYTLAKLRFPGKPLVFALIMSTLFVPTQMLVIPWYQMAVRYGWLDTHWGIIFPGLIPAFGVFLMRQAFSVLPNDLIDAARIDGLNEFGIFLRVALPLVRPALATLGILTFVGNWSAFVWPLIVSQRKAMYTLPVGIALFSGEAGSKWNLIAAASVLGTVPMLVIFVLFQRLIIRGAVMSGLK